MKENIMEKVHQKNGAESRPKYIEFWKGKYNKLNEMMMNIADYEVMD